MPDGKSHPLASVRPWSLPDWKARFPATISLTDELNWAILQSELDAGAQDIGLPAGRIVVNHSLRSCGRAIRLWGKGENISFVEQVGTGEDAISHCAESRSAGDGTAPIDVGGLSILCDAPQGCGTAIIIRGGAGLGWNRITDLTVSPKQGTWASGIKTLAATKTIMRDLVINGSLQPVQSDSKSTGIIVESEEYGKNRLANASFGTFIYTSEIFGWGTCLRFLTASYNGVEGVYVDHSSCDSSLSFVRQENLIYNPPQQYYQAPIYNFTDNQIHTSVFAMSFRSASQVALMGNVFYIDPGSSAQDWLLFKDVSGLSISNNHFSAYPGTSLRTVISMLAVVNGDVHDNVFDNGLGQARVQISGIYADNRCVNVVEHNNIWLNWDATRKPKYLK